MRCCHAKANEYAAKGSRKATKILLVPTVIPPLLFKVAHTDGGGSTFTFMPS